MKKLLLTILTLIPLTSLAELYNYKVIKVIDGDTILIEAPYLPKPLKPEISLRIFGVDTPEKGFRSHCELEAGLGEEATQFVTKLIHDTAVVKVELKEWDKYGGRVLGDLLLDGVSLRQTLIKAGFAHVYYGEQKQSWCEK